MKFAFSTCDFILAGAIKQLKNETNYLPKMHFVGFSLRP